MDLPPRALGLLQLTADQARPMKPDELVKRWLAVLTLDGYFESFIQQGAESLHMVCELDGPQVWTVVGKKTHHHKMMMMNIGTLRSALGLNLHARNQYRPATEPAAPEQPPRPRDDERDLERVLSGNSTLDSVNTWRVHWGWPPLVLPKPEPAKHPPDVKPADEPVLEVSVQVQVKLGVADAPVEAPVADTPAAAPELDALVAQLAALDVAPREVLAPQPAPVPPEDPYHELSIQWSQLVVGEQVGQGSFKTVHKCRFQQCTLALVRFGQGFGQGELRGQELRGPEIAELEVLRRMSHPNTTRLFGVVRGPTGAAEGWLTELCVDLRQVLAQSPTPTLEQRKGWLRDVAAALEYLHGAFRTPIVHRDVKTANVLVNGSARLGDFALARRQQDGQDSLGTVAPFAGTASFKAPEQWAGMDVTKQVDIYGFGGVVVETLTGQQPWSRCPSKEIQRKVTQGTTCPELSLLNLDQEHDRDGAASMRYTQAWACLNQTPKKRPSARQCRVFWQKQLDGKSDEERALQDRTCLERFLDTCRLLTGDERLRVFISYAWFPPQDPRLAELQLKLSMLKEHLKHLGADVFLDISGDMVGSLEQKMADGIASADFILIVGTTRMKERAESSESPKNNIQFEHAEAAERWRKKPDAVVCVLAEGDVQQSFPERLGASSRALPVTDELVDIRTDAAYCASVVKLVKRLLPKLNKDPRFMLLQDLLRMQLCTHRAPDRPATEKERVLAGREGLTRLAQHLKLEARPVTCTCTLLVPAFQQGQEHLMGRLADLKNFLKNLGVSFVDSATAQDRNSRLLVVGTKNLLDVSEQELVREFVRSRADRVVPVVLDGGFETAFPGLASLRKVLAIDLTTWPWSHQALAQLAGALFGWDLDDQVWFARSVSLYKLSLARHFHECELCRPAVVAPAAVPPVTHALVPTVLEEKTAEQEQEQEQDDWARLQAKIPQLRKVTPEGLRKVPEAMVTKFADSLEADFELVVRFYEIYRAK